MKKVLILVFIFIFTFINFKTINSKSLNEGKLYPINIYGKWGFIDTNGKVVLEPKFNKFEDLGDGYYLAYSSDWVRDFKGTYIIMPKRQAIKICSDYEFVILSDNKKYLTVFKNIYEGDIILINSFIVDLDTGKTLETNKEERYEEYESSNLIVAFNNYYIEEDQLSYKLRLVNYKNQILSESYDVKDFSESLILDKGNTAYWFDKNGKVIFEYKNCLKALTFYKGIAAIIDEDSNLKFIDNSKKVVSTYTGAKNISREGDYYLVESEDKNIFINANTLKEVSSNDNKKIIYLFEETLLGYNMETLVLDIYDEKGNIKTSCKLPQNVNDKDTLPQITGNNVILLTENGYGICKIHKEDTVWILEPKYLQIKIFDENMIYVVSNHFSGYVDSSGKRIYIQPLNANYELTFN